MNCGITKILKGIGDFVFVEHEPEKSDIIFIPGSSDSAPSECAARLYKNGFAPFILPSGMYSIKHGKFAGVGNYNTEWEFMHDVLVENGVPENCILKEDKSSFTKQNADFSRHVTDNLGIEIKKALICCKSFHSRRAYMYYQLAFPNTEFFICPVEIKGINKSNWHTTEYGIDRVMGELRRCADQFGDEFKNNTLHKQFYEVK